MTVAVRRLRLTVAYDGTQFCGWQLQPRGRTVQGVLESAMASLGGVDTVRVEGAGRTDAGVHARGQVAHADLATRLDDPGVRHALGCMLPVDVRVAEVRTVRGRFHARHDARGKVYRYRIDTSPHGDPLVARYALHHAGPLDKEKIREALDRLAGRHDWSGFAASACTVGNRIRDLSEARLEIAGDDLSLWYHADGFLHHMVRNITGTLLEIGRGRMELGSVERILNSGDRGLAGPTAPPHGLCLERVLYEDD